MLLDTKFLFMEMLYQLVWMSVEISLMASLFQMITFVFHQFDPEEFCSF